MAKIGYARVSSESQSLALQLDALHGAACTKIFSDRASGALLNRKGLHEAFEYLQSGDTLVVWRLDRLGRSLKDLIDNVNNLAAKNISFCSLQEQIDTTTPGGILIFHVFGALAQFERSLISQRTISGLEAARARGRIGGRPAKMDSKKVATAQRLLEDPNLSVEDVCIAMQVSKSTLYRWLPQS